MFSLILDPPNALPIKEEYFVGKWERGRKIFPKRKILRSLSGIYPHPVCRNFATCGGTLISNFRDNWASSAVTDVPDIALFIYIPLGTRRFIWPT